jgi:hypothetical protein
LIDNLSILLSHGLLILSFWILIRSETLNNEPPPPHDKEPEGFAHGRLNPRAGKRSSGSGDSADA